jgi:hypothetical protein
LPSLQQIQHVEQPAYFVRRPPQPQESIVQSKRQISFESLKLPQYIAYYDAVNDETNINVRQQMIMLDSLIL